MRSRGFGLQIGVRGRQHGAVIVSRRPEIRRRSDISARENIFQLEVLAKVINRSHTRRKRRVAEAAVAVETGAERSFQLGRGLPAHFQISAVAVIFHALPIGDFNFGSRVVFAGVINEIRVANRIFGRNIGIRSDNSGQERKIRLQGRV